MAIDTFSAGLTDWNLFRHCGSGANKTGENQYYHRPFFHNKLQQNVFDNLFASLRQTRASFIALVLIAQLKIL
jgi:hypothetical protein